MAGWTRQKREAVETAFYTYLDRCVVNSKDAGSIRLGENLYDGQRRFIATVFDSFEKDIHKIYVLKSRQLGLSTIARALSTFLIGINPGLKGACVFDSENNKNESRAELETMIRDLPKTLKFPLIKATNRAGLTLSTDSKILFMSAGTRKSKTSGTLGRSVGLSLAHLSELCSYDNDEGLIAFENSLSDVNPDRLYIYESTARGFNTWYKMWDRARNDPAHCACLFLGWWSKPSQAIAQDEPDFELYGLDPPTNEEVKKIEIVQEKYDHTITVEQLAWIRRKMDPRSSQVMDADEDSEEDDPALVQEQPWTEEEAFQLTGAKFFPAKTLLDQTTLHVSNKFKGYMFLTGNDFADTKAFPAENFRYNELKVWEEPDPSGVYILSCDPAFGENDLNDRSSIQIGRCYADGLDQVAEYSSPLVNTNQLAWVIAALLGWYGAEKQDIRYILELNGPGTAVFLELKALRHQIDNAYMKTMGKIEAQNTLQDIFRNVKTYIYTRPDGMAAGQNYHFKSNTGLKVTIMEQFRSFVMGGLFCIRSAALIKEMQAVAREGDKINGPDGGYDDRVVSAAYLSHYWDASVRRGLIVQKKTREFEASRKRKSLVDVVNLFNENNFQSFLAGQRSKRLTQERQLRRLGWRQGGRVR